MLGLSVRVRVRVRVINRSSIYVKGRKTIGSFDWKEKVNFTN